MFDRWGPPGVSQVMSPALMAGVGSHWNLTEICFSRCNFILKQKERTFSLIKSSLKIKFSSDFLWYLFIIPQIMMQQIGTK